MILDPEVDLRALESEITVFSYNIFRHYDEWPVAFVELNKLIQEVRF